MKRRQFSSLLASAAVVAAVSGCGLRGRSQVSHQGLGEKETLLWGASSDDGAPYVFYDPSNPGRLVGYELEIVDAIAELMGVRHELVDMSFSELETGLARDDFHIIFNGWTVAPEYTNTQIFSIPYYVCGQQFLVRANDSRFTNFNEQTPGKIEDYFGLTVGATQYYPAEYILEEYPQIKAKVYEDYQPFDSLADGYLDAILMDTPIVSYGIAGIGPGAQPDSRLKIASQPIFPDNYVMAINKANPNAAVLQSELNQALTILKDNGTLKKIYQRWGLWNDEQQKIGLT
jgi:polar amino acid transport system substrate-binding protein